MKTLNKLTISMFFLLQLSLSSMHAMNSTGALVKQEETTETQVTALQAAIEDALIFLKEASEILIEQAKIALKNLDINEFFDFTNITIHDAANPSNPPSLPGKILTRLNISPLILRIAQCIVLSRASIRVSR